MLAYLLFFFVAVGAKLLLALFTIYLLFPTDTRCSGCDGDTLLLRMGATGRMFARCLFLGRVERRWCPRCGWEGMARRSASRTGIRVPVQGPRPGRGRTTPP